MVSAMGRRSMRLVVARLVAMLLVGLCVVATPSPSWTQEADAGDRLVASLEREWPDLYGRLMGLERAHGVLYGALGRGKGQFNEADLFERLKERNVGTQRLSDPGDDADKGYATLGKRTAEVIRRAHGFHREVLAIFASVQADARAAALDAAVERYRSRPDVALPAVPKDMTVLYDHPYTSFTDEGFNPRRQQPYPSLAGFVWAAHWFQLAAQEPLEIADDREARAAGLRTVTERFERKLSAGKAPDAFPTELPLAPSIAPGLVTIHERSAVILDNMNMLHDVLMDILAHPTVANRRAAVEEAVTQFLDPRHRVVDVDEWIKMALRHSIFEQGGPALMTMVQTDRNGSGHAQHVRGGRAIPPGGMR